MDYAQFWKSTRKVIGIGRNYAAHAKELGNPISKEIVIFTKPLTSLLPQGNPIIIPEGAVVHHEVELGVIMGTKGKNIAIEEASAHIAGYCIALDMTARNIQVRIKAEGLPWDRAKGWDTSCPVGPFIPARDIKFPATIWLKLNGDLKQRSSTANMLHSINELVSECSKVMTLEPGDLILTGTPSGVSEVAPGDIITCGIEGVCDAKWVCQR